MSKFRVLDAARLVDDEVVALLSNRKYRMLSRVQLAKASESIGSNIREAEGRREGPEREQFWRYARGSAEETDEHMRRNFIARRIPAVVCWRLHHRLRTIINMLDELMEQDEAS